MILSIKAEIFTLNELLYFLSENLICCGAPVSRSKVTQGSRSMGYLCFGVQDGGPTSMLSFWNFFIKFGLFTMQRRAFSYLITFNNSKMSILGGSWLTGYFVTSLTKRFTSQESSTSSNRSDLIDAIRSNKMSNSTLSTFATKPPNILVYTEIVDKNRNFDVVRSQLGKVVSPDSYTIYALDDRKVLEHPWSKNSVLLIIYNNILIEDNIMNEFKSYMENGGSILSVGTGGSKLVDGVELRELHSSARTLNIDVKSESLNLQERVLVLDCEPFYFAGK